MKDFRDAYIWSEDDEKAAEEEYKKAAAVCKKKGHAWQTDSDPEYGSEEMYCDRCGLVHTAYHG